MENSDKSDPQFLFSLTTTWVNLCAFQNWNLNFLYVLGMCMCEYVVSSMQQKCICGKLFPFLQNYSSSFFDCRDFAERLLERFIANYPSGLGWWFGVSYFMCKVDAHMQFANAHIHTHTIETLTKRFTSWMNKFYLRKNGIKFFIVTRSARLCCLGQCESVCDCARIPYI